MLTKAAIYLIKHAVKTSEFSASLLQSSASRDF